MTGPDDEVAVVVVGWQPADDGDRAALVRAIVDARRATRARAAFFVWVWMLIPSVGGSALVPGHRLWGALAGMATDTLICLGYLLASRRTEPRTVTALRGGEAAVVVGLSSFSNGTNTAFTRVRFADGRVERLEDVGLAKQLSAVLEVPLEREPRGSLW